LLLALAPEKAGIGVNKARGFIEILIENGKIKEVDIPREKKKPAIGYLQTPD
jgi:hypothetical protein